MCVYFKNSMLKAGKEVVEVSEADLADSFFLSLIGFQISSLYLLRFHDRYLSTAIYVWRGRNPYR